MNIKIETEPKTTLTEIKKDVKFIKDSIGEELGLKREQFKLPNGLILLRGYSKHTNSWLNLTNVIGDFDEYVKKNDFIEYKLYCHVQTR